MIARGAVCLNRARMVLRRGGGSNAVRLLHKIAEYLKVPVEYLLNPVSAGSKNEYSLRENQLIEQYRRLAEDKKIEIERKMGYLASLQEFENEQ